MTNTRMRLIEETVRIREAAVDGMWLMPRVNTDDSIWDGIFFCRHGPLAPSVVRFSINQKTLILFNGIQVSTPYSLLEEPLQLQLWIKSLLEGAEVQYDPLQTLTYEYLFGHQSDRSSIQFKDTKSLTELDAVLLRGNEA